MYRNVILLYHAPASLFLVVSFLFYSPTLLGQDRVEYFHSPYAVQYGYGLKGSLEWSKLEKLYFRLGVTAGVGVLAGKWIYPSLNAELSVYSGGIGSSKPGRSGGKWLDLESVISYTATAGWAQRLRKESRYGPDRRSYPLYYFNNQSLPSLQNPFRWSASFGGNIVIFHTRQKNKMQRVGFANLHFDRVQVNYANDGPFFRPPFGDLFDRYYTGTGFVAFHGDLKWDVNIVELSYNKFTGYSPSSYEISNKLGSSYVFYKDEKENFYNKSNFQLNVGNIAKHWGLTGVIYNYPWSDVQHTIHSKSYYTLHLVTYDGTIAAGPLLYFQQARIGQQ